MTRLEYEAKLGEINKAELSVKHAIEEFPPDSLTSKTLIIFALKKVADLGHYFEDIVDNVLTEEEEIRRLLLDEAEEERLWENMLLFQEQLITIKQN